MTPSCWKCKEPVGGPVCVGCGAIQPPTPDPDLFAILGLHRTFNLDPDALGKAYRLRSRQVHPDRFAGRSAVERRMSLQWTAAINTARRVLKDPLSRAHYLATGKARPDERGGPELDAEFLEEMFELRMEAPDDPEGVRDKAQTQRNALVADLEAIFEAWEAGSGDLDAVEERLARLRYLDGLLGSNDLKGE